MNQEKTNKYISKLIILFGALLIIIPVINVLWAGVLNYQYTQLTNIFRGLFVFVSIFCGAGILLKKEWARKIIIIFSSFIFLILVLSIFAINDFIFSRTSILNYAWMLFYSGATLLFFSSKVVKNKFNK